jgi:hypothetical protein
MAANHADVSDALSRIILAVDKILNTSQMKDNLKIKYKMSSLEVKQDHAVENVHLIDINRQVLYLSTRKCLP